MVTYTNCTPLSSITIINRSSIWIPLISTSFLIFFRNLSLDKGSAACSLGTSSDDMQLIFFEFPSLSRGAYGISGHESHAGRGGERETGANRFEPRPIGAATGYGHVISKVGAIIWKS